MGGPNDSRRLISQIEFVAHVQEQLFSYSCICSSSDGARVIRAQQICQKGVDISLQEFLHFLNNLFVECKLELQSDGLLKSSKIEICDS